MQDIANHHRRALERGAERALLLLSVTGLDPTTMSRTTGELSIPIDGKPVRYRYKVRGIVN